MDTTNIHVTHTIAGMSRLSGGTSRVVRDLTNTLALNAEFKITLLSQGGDEADILRGRYEAGVNECIAYSSSRLSLMMGRPLRELLRTDLASRGNPAILHDHGIWTLCNHHMASMSRTYGIPLVIHPHGMLEPWALAYRAYKKKLAWALYEKKDLASAALFFATSHAEVENIRTLGFKQPIAMIPNGVELPGYELRGLPEKDSGRMRYVVFMSRIHPKKGLLELMRAWDQVRPHGWRLILAGPDGGGHLQDVMAAVRKYGLKDMVEYRGTVEGRAKADLFKQADLFVLPSFSENFGVVVAEALAYGVPVIATKGTPWKGLVDNQCGWWVSPEAKVLASALFEGITLNDQQRRDMGVRGQEYAQQFDWSQIAYETANVYSWLLGQAPRPDCVRLD